MPTVLLLIDDTVYELDDNAEPSKLRQQLLDAAAAAPAYVSFTPAGFSDVTVLVTGHTRIRFHTRARANAVVEWAGQVSDVALAFYDVDSFGFSDDPAEGEPESAGPGSPETMSEAS